MLKKMFVLSAALLLIGISSGFAQSPGSILFGSEENPEIIVPMSNPNWNNLRMSIFTHTVGTKVDWEEVKNDVAALGMNQLASWMKNNPQLLAAGYVYVICCGGPTGVCKVRVPLSCDLCNNAPGCDKTSDTGVKFTGIFMGLN